jgi:endonuclease/exonuclease/phosphatase family metal-dependent hydrolase
MLTIASWNIWFDDFLREARTNLVIRQLKQADVDIIALQEVVPETAKQLRKKFASWHFAGFPLTQSYDTLIISKHKIIDTQRIPLPHTNMGRNLLIATIYHEPSGEVYPVATFHLESEFGQMRIMKQMQLIFCFQQLVEMQDANLILLGDTNITRKDEETETIDFLKDAYEGAYQPAAYNYTYDGRRNNNVKNKRYRSRLDRIYYSKKNLKLEAFSFLGDTPCTTSVQEDQVYPSDHFGLLTKFSLSR